MWLMSCLPCVKGGGPSFAWWKDCFMESKYLLNNPSPPAAELPLHKGAFCSYPFTGCSACDAII